MLWFVAGINGTGKSTISCDPLLLAFMGVTAVVNPDEIAREIAHTKGVEYRLANLSAAIITQSMMFSEAVLSDTPTMAMETVLSTDKYNPVLEIAEQRRIQVGLVYVSVCSVELTLQRIKTRVAAGLHDVPEETVRARWPKTLKNCAYWSKRVDRLIVLANNYSDGRPILVARKLAKTGSIEILDREELPELISMLEKP